MDEIIRACKFKEEGPLDLTINYVFLGENDLYHMITRHKKKIKENVWPLNWG